jgi:hypothetical protein
LIGDALGAEAPTAAAREAWIAAGNQVVGDATSAELNGRIGHGADQLATAIEQDRFDQSGQAIHSGEIGVSTRPLHQRLQLAEAPELIQSPSLTAIAKGGGLTDPTQEAMHWWMHPRHGPSTVIQALITAHPPAQEVTQQQLLRQAH